MYISQKRLFHAAVTSLLGNVKQCVDFSFNCVSTTGQQGALQPDSVIQRLVFKGRFCVSAAVGKGGSKSCTHSLSFPLEVMGHFCLHSIAWGVPTMCWMEERSGVFVRHMTATPNSLFVPWEDKPKSLAPQHCAVQQLVWQRRQLGSD